MATSILKKQKVYFGIALCAVFFGLISSFASATPSFEISAQKEPTVSGTAVAPATQNAGGNIIVTSQIVDVSGVKSAKIEVKNSTNVIVATINLYDDGVHNDGAANDNIYGVEWKIPASFSAGTYKIFVVASDAFGYISDTEQVNFIVIVPACVENWTCGAWSACASGVQTRTCADSNNCGTTANKPAVSQACAAAPVLTSIVVTPANPTIAAGGTQTFIASPKDQYGNSIAAIVAWSSGTPVTGTIVAGTGDFTAVTAGTTVIAATSGAVSGNTVVTVAASCVENWICSAWSACASGVQTRTCADSNNCGTTVNKPAEIQNCLSVAITDPNDGFKVAQDGMPINLQATALGGNQPYSYNWKDNGTVFGDSQPWQMLNPLILSIGNHIISAQATDANLSAANDSITIEILPAGSLTAQIQMWQTEFARDPLIPAMFNVQANGGTAPYTFVWNSDKQGDFSIAQWPSIDVSGWALGTHKITVTVKDSGGKTATDLINIAIVEMALSVMPQEGQTFIKGENINFSAMVQGGIMPYNFQWTSSMDGGITPASDPKDNFQKNNLSVGTHTITVTVTDSSAPQKTVSKQVHITVNQAPTLTADIFSPADGSTTIQGNDISFQAAVSGGVFPYVYKWISDKDGQLSVNKDFTKNNLSVGNHKITFTVSDNSGQTAAKTVNITISAPISITVNITSPNNGDSFYAGDSIIHFISAVSGGVSPYIYQWSSNISGNLSDKNEFYATNLAQGNHTITLKITDQNNNTQTASVGIKVNPEPDFANIKDMTKYSAKETFLISHKNWQNVLPLVSMVVWPGNKYPLLAYHEENHNSLDLNSVKLESGIIFKVSPYTAININGTAAKSYIYTDTQCDSPTFHEIVILDKYFIPTNVNVGDLTALKVKIKNCSNTQTKQFNNIKLEDYAYKEGMTVSNAFQFFGITLAPKEEKIITFNFNFNAPVSTFDADSAIHFFQLYNPSHLTTVGTTPAGVNNLLTAAPETGAGLAGKISNINSADYFSYWSSIKSVVAVDYNNYQAGHNAAVFASYKNAPIIFINSANLDAYKTLINGKVVYTVGNLDAAAQNYINSNAGTKISYSLEDLQRWYIDKTNTDKVILINIDDLNNDYQDFSANGFFNTDKSGRVYNLLQRLSLASSLLAADKNELIIPAVSGDITSAFISSEIDKLFPLPNKKILTIVGERDLIPLSFIASALPSNVSSAGRINGVTSTDSFSYINRAIFFQDLFNVLYPGNTYKELEYSSENPLGTGDYEILRDVINKQEVVHYWSQLSHKTNLDTDHFKQRQFIRFLAHGSSSGPAFIWKGNLPYLQLSFGSAGSCSTGKFDGVDSFSINWLRKGGISYYGAIVNILQDQAWSAYTKPMEILRTNPNISLGEMNSKLLGMPAFSLFGDPTINLIYKGGDNELPKLCFIIGNKTGLYGGVENLIINSGESVWLSGCGSDNDGSIVNREWDFEGDGIYDLSGVNNSAQVTHTYNTAGTYKATFKATDNEGATATTFKWIVVN